MITCICSSFSKVSSIWRWEICYYDVQATNILITEIFITSMAEKGKLYYIAMHEFTCKPKTSCSNVYLSSEPMHNFVMLSIANLLQCYLFGLPWSNAFSPMNFMCTHTYSRIIHNTVKIHAYLCMHMKRHTYMCFIYIVMTYLMNIIYVYICFKIIY